MVDWGDPELIDTIMVVYSGMCCFLFGMYLWYLALSFHKVELGLLTGRTQLQLSHGPYLIARYCCLATLIMLVWMPIVAKAFPSPSSSCPGTWYTRLVLAMGETALSAASYNLSLRAMILWNERKIVLWTLRIICLGQLVYSFVAAMIGTQQQWDPNHTYCTVGIVPSAKNVIMALLIFTLSWDAFILVMTLLGIRRKQLQGSAISVALLTQGMGYVAAQVTVIIPVLLGLLLQLNEVMNVFFFPLGCTISIMASSASVTSLLDVKGIEAEISRSSCQVSAMPGRRRTGGIFTSVMDLPTVQDSSVLTCE